MCTLHVFMIIFYKKGSSIKLFRRTHSVLTRRFRFQINHSHSFGVCVGTLATSRSEKETLRTTDPFDRAGGAVLIFSEDNESLAALLTKNGWKPCKNHSPKTAENEVLHCLCKCHLFREGKKIGADMLLCIYALYGSRGRPVF